MSKSLLCCLYAMRTLEDIHSVTFAQAVHRVTISHQTGFSYCPSESPPDRRPAQVPRASVRAHTPRRDQVV